MINALSSIKSLIPQVIKHYFKRFRTRDKLGNSIAPILPSCVCIDVGASYYPHMNWWLFLRSPLTQWIAVEPNKDNLGYTNSWSYLAKIKTVSTGLSRTGGNQTLYVTNVDSGSSLLEPVISENMKYRVKDKGYAYFFPINKVQIDTVTLASIVDGENPEYPVFVKLDTQGTELSILQGAEMLLQNKRIVGIEMESTLLAEPLMRGSAKFWEACQYLEGMGFELLGIKPIIATSNLNIKNPKGNRYLNECDAIFALRWDIVSTLPMTYRISLLGFYITYGYYEEAILAIDRDNDIQSYFVFNNIKFEEIKRLILALA
jgi:FkbM family methyltransferase